MVFVIILRLVHFIVAIGIFVRQWLNYFTFVGLAFQRKIFAGSFQNSSKSFNKIPIHIGILFLEDTINYEDVANVLLWSITLGISYISLFDVNGEFYL